MAPPRFVFSGTNVFKVAEVLGDGATIGVTVRLLDLLFPECWKSLEQKCAQLIGPHEVHDFLVREHGI